MIPFFCFLSFLCFFGRKFNSDLVIVVGVTRVFINSGWGRYLTRQIRRQRAQQATWHESFACLITRMEIRNVYTGNPYTILLPHTLVHICCVAGNKRRKATYGDGHVVIPYKVSTKAKSWWRYFSAATKWDDCHLLARDSVYSPIPLLVRGGGWSGIVLLAFVHTIT